MRPSTMKAIKTLLRLQKEEVDRLLMERSACFAEIEKLKKEKEISLERLEKERQFAGDISSYQTFSEFTKKIQDKIDAVDKEIERQLMKAADLEQAFINAYKTQKSQENVLTKVQEEKLSKEKSLENQTLDEIGLIKFIED